MLIPYSPSAKPLTRLTDGMVKQISPLTRAEVWTMPGRANRPISHPMVEVRPLEEADRTHSCTFYSAYYLETPPGEVCVAHGADGGFKRLDAVAASALFDTVTKLRQVPNLFEVLSFDYWHINHGCEIPDAAREYMGAYLVDPISVEHVERVARTKLTAAGMDPDSWDSMGERTRHTFLATFFVRDHDVIIGRRHFTDDAHGTTGSASSGTLSVAKHRAYTHLAIHAMHSPCEANRWVCCVAVFQNWLRPARASFGHLHKQLADIDERGVTSQLELQKMRASPSLYNEMMVDYTAYQGLLVASNKHAVAFAGFGRRYPTLEMYLTSAIPEPWLVSHEEADTVFNLVCVLHVATGADMLSSGEWHHKPLDMDQPISWHITLKWRVSTLTSFEDGTKIYLNTIDPWTLRDRAVACLEGLWADRLIAPIAMGEECPTTLSRLLYGPVLTARP